jgi:hypothetical protein
MLTQEEWMDIHLLARQGHSIRSIAQLTGSGRNTARRALRQQAHEPYNTAHRSSKLDEFKHTEKRYNESGLSGVPSAGRDPGNGLRRQSAHALPVHQSLGRNKQTIEQSDDQIRNSARAPGASRLGVPFLWTSPPFLAGLAAGEGSR